MLTIDVPLLLVAGVPRDALVCQWRFICWPCICFPGELAGAAVMLLALWSVSHQSHWCHPLCTGTARHPSTAVGSLRSVTQAGASMATCFKHWLAQTRQPLINGLILAPSFLPHVIFTALPQRAPGTLQTEKSREYIGSKLHTGESPDLLDESELGTAAGCLKEGQYQGKGH